MPEKEKRRQDLLDLVISFRENPDRVKLEDLAPLKRYVFKCVKINRSVGLCCEDDKEDVFAVFLSIIHKSEVTPTYWNLPRYIRHRIINSMVELGYIKDDRYRISRQIKPVYEDDLQLDEAPFLDADYEKAENRAEARLLFDRKKTELLWKDKTSLFD